MGRAGPRDDGSDDRTDEGRAGASASDGDADGDGEGEAAGGRPCPLCGTGMVRRHCKYVCPNHGVVYDCADTFW
jgi:hypothetical protein